MTVTRAPSRGRDAAILVALLAVALGLRLWRLDDRPLSPDEILTTLVAIGRSHRDVPIGAAFPLSQVEGLLSPVYGRSWGEIWATLSDPQMHHAHPPLFYWLTYEVVGWLRPGQAELVFVLRLLPAVLGAAVVAAVYALARSVASPRAALVAAAMMAVSPLAILLAQDARNYALPLLLVVVALHAMVVLVRAWVADDRPAPGAWALWVVANALGCYSHYFTVLSIAAQAAALLLVVWRDSPPAARRGVAASRIAAALLATALLCLPLARVLHADYRRLSAARSDNEWLKPPGLAGPLVEAAGGWLSMVGPVPNEAMSPRQRLLAVGLGALAVLGVAVAIAAAVRRRRTHPGPPEVAVLAAFAALAWLELAAIVYLLQKDVFRYWRYHFVYFPAAIVLLAWALEQAAARRPRAGLATVALLASCLGGTLFGAFGLGIQDAYNSRRIAREVVRERRSTLTVMGGDSFLTTSIGLSVAREIAQSWPEGAASTLFAYVPWGGAGAEELMRRSPRGTADGFTPAAEPDSDAGAAQHPFATEQPRDPRPGSSRRRDPMSGDARWPGRVDVALPPQRVWLVHPPAGDGWPARVELNSQTASLTCTPGATPPRVVGLAFRRYDCER